MTSRDTRPLEHRPTKTKPLPPRDEDARRWADFCAGLGDRIKAIRYEEAGALCPTCGSTTPEVPAWKQCPGCDTVQPSVNYARHAGRYDGLQVYCRQCRKRLLKTWRSTAALKSVAS